MGVRVKRNEEEKNKILIGEQWGREDKDIDRWAMSPRMLGWAVKSMFIMKLNCLSVKLSTGDGTGWWWSMLTCPSSFLSWFHHLLLLVLIFKYLESYCPLLSPDWRSLELVTWSDHTTLSLTLSIKSNIGRLGRSYLPVRITAPRDI